MLALAGCSDRGKATGNEDMKRPPALLQFEGYVYVPTETSDFKILERVRAQTRSVFTGLRRSRVMVSRREVQGATTDNLLKEAVTVVDAAGQRNVALRVRYRFVARPEVANGIDDRKELALALLHREDDAVAERVLRECTANQDVRKGGASAVGLDFDPSLPGCRAAIDAEQAAIDAARAKVPELAGAPASVKDTVVPAEEVRRVYIPTRVTVELRARRPGEVAPRYAPVDRPEEPEQDARIATATPRGGGEGQEALEPAAVIVDPDLSTQRTPEEQALAAEGALLPRLPATGGTNVEIGGRRLPEVVAPATAQAQQRKVEPANERFEIPFETLADPKFLVVWLSLLMAYPILRGDPRKRR
ncbi:hypothetical protein SOCE836_107480 [Sorangium cellulosum]|uniref:Uncharacterized protein n=2 Tax=Polyangiaceae TaxID=49 RepID=A0A4P2R5T5_SORCE|nr:hypothetical protein SOCE836_107480 [Sorangium cellulosum]WCQ97790.1 hypothetical protein NQZ70_10588 [Sorangium sp. Soce836]